MAPEQWVWEGGLGGFHSLKFTLNRGELYARRAEREGAEARGGGRLDGGQRGCFVAAADAHPLFGEGITDQVAQGDGASPLRCAVDDAE